MPLFFARSRSPGPRAHISIAVKGLAVCGRINRPDLFSNDGGARSRIMSQEISSRGYQVAFAGVTVSPQDWRCEVVTKEAVNSSWTRDIACDEPQQNPFNLRILWAAIVARSSSSEVRLPWFVSG